MQKDFTMPDYNEKRNVHQRGKGHIGRFIAGAVDSKFPFFIVIFILALLLIMLPGRVLPAPTHLDRVTGKTGSTVGNTDPASPTDSIDVPVIKQATVQVLSVVTSPLLKSGSGVSIPQADGTHDGYLDLDDWTLFETVTTKEPAITATTSADYWRGDKTFHTLNTAAVPESGNLYYTDLRARAAISLVSPLSYDPTNGVISIGNAVADGSTKGVASFGASDFNASSGNVTIDYTNGQKASASQPGLLDSPDFITFAAKQNAITTGTMSQFIDGTLALQDITSVVRGKVSATSPILYNNSTGVVSFDQSANNTTNDGRYLRLIGGTLTGSLTDASGFIGPLTGNASTASALSPGAAINGVTFTGAAPVTVTAASGTLTGTTLAANVVNSSLLTAAGGTFNTGAFAAVAAGANPSASIGTTAVNGSSANFMRADAAPAIDQGLSPTWTGTHTFGTTGVLRFEGATADSFKTTLGVVDPTNNISWMLMNSAGTKYLIWSLFKWNTGMVLVGNAGNSTMTSIDGVIIGQDTGSAITSAQQVVYIGKEAGVHATIGIANIGVGEAALWNLTTGMDNTGVGSDALSDGLNAAGVTTGNNNSGFGNNAGQTVVATVNTNQTGDDNSAFGHNSGWGTAPANRATSIGAFAFTDANNQVMLGGADGADTVTMPGPTDLRGSIKAAAITTITPTAILGRNSSNQLGTMTTIPNSFVNFSAPAAIGSGTPAAVTATALSSTGTTTLGDAGADILTINSAVPSMPNIGTVSPNALIGITTGGDVGKFTSIDNSFVKWATPSAIGSSTPAAGTFTALTSTSTTTIGDASGDALTINPAAPTAPNLGTITPASYLGISSGNVIGKCSAPSSDLEAVLATGNSSQFVMTLLNQQDIFDSGFTMMSWGDVGINGTVDLAWNKVTQSVQPFANSVLTNYHAQNLIADGGVNITQGGSADRAGIVTLSSGTATINTTSITANSQVHISINGSGTLANLGIMYEDKPNRVVGTSFVLKCVNVLSNATLVWEIIEPN